jgi:hypothetical protein
MLPSALARAGGGRRPFRWDGVKVSGPEFDAASAAAGAAANGARNSAFMSSLQTAIGSGYKRKLLRDGVVVWEATVSGTLPIANNAFVLPSSATQVSIAAADIDTGVWVHRIEHATIPGRFIATRVTPAAGEGPAKLSADLEAGGTVSLGSFTLFSPALDSSLGAGVDDVNTMVFHMTINDPAWTPNGGPNNPYMKGGNIATGGDSRSNALPTWYGSTTNQYLTQNGYGPSHWNTLQPWYVVWDAIGHQAGLNVVCVFKDLELWWLGDGMNTWQRLTISPSPGGDPFQRDIITPGGNVQYGTYPDGLRWVKLSPTGSVFHGYQGQITTGTNGFNTTQIVALHTRIKTRIQLENPSGPDQLSQARYLMQAGLDLYPFSGAALPSDGYWPGCMSSRWQPVTTSWQTVYATTLASAYNVDNNSRAPGGYSSRQKISEAAFRANPPPVS